MSPGLADSGGENSGAIQFDAKTVAQLRVEMLRFARFNLGATDACEDVVQEALEGAIRNAATFKGQSTLKTWVFSILRRRIVDHLRRDPGAVPISSIVDDDDDWQQQMDSLFDAHGHWFPETRPSSWPAPDEAVESKQFWLALEACMEILPGTTGRVFMLREILGLESEEICQQVGITLSNLHVILHRGRMKLRACLENGWVLAGGAAC